MGTLLFKSYTMLKYNKVGNWKWLFCAQNLRNLQPCEKIKLGTRDVSFSFLIILVYNKVGNSIDEPGMEEIVLSLSDPQMAKEWNG